MWFDDFYHVKKVTFLVSFGVLDHVIHEHVDVNLIEVSIEMDYQQSELSPCQTDIGVNLSKPQIQ